MAQKEDPEDEEEESLSESDVQWKKFCSTTLTKIEKNYNRKLGFDKSDSEEKKKEEEEEDDKDDGIEIDRVMENLFKKLNENTEKIRDQRRGNVRQVKSMDNDSDNQNIKETLEGL